MKFIILFAYTLAVSSAFDLRGEEIYECELYVPVVDEQIEGRITNGKNAAPNQFPYQVGLLLTTANGTVWCGGSLIGKNWILAVDHCTESSAQVQLGGINRTSPIVSYTVDKYDIIVHRECGGPSKHDIALIHIPTVQ